ncbi:MAG: SirA family protein [Candidatus Aminicenantes bacterium RBG_13_59_9]|jgi:TusA-related sulfurtransferase|nr:MAG: SirA family protein [Candidatus Aminicenantes bacterium RBG_13_59_9]
MESIKADVTLDCFGLLCPVPIIQTAQKMKTLRVGQVLEVISTDRGIEADLPAWCRTTGHEFLGAEVDGEIIKAYVRKTRD